jgi:ferredoxin-NADP reductase
MLATGTALGVYLSMLKTADAWERFERVILVHGARNTGELAYGETIAEIQAAHEDKFTFITALTRDSSETALQGRITNCWRTAPGGRGRRRHQRRRQPPDALRQLGDDQGRARLAGGPRHATPQAPRARPLHHRAVSLTRP